MDTDLYIHYLEGMTLEKRLRLLQHFVSVFLLLLLNSTQLPTETFGINNINSIFKLKNKYMNERIFLLDTTNVTKIIYLKYPEY